MCENCGFYRGKEMIDVLTKLTKKERKTKEREMTAQEKTEQKPAKLNPEQLSKS